MARGSKIVVEAELRTLFEAGSVAGLSDGELLDRFLAQGDPAAELAFAALVERHGPMVWRVCREVLRESNDADDAFQATFLILVRRARAIRKQASVGPWLYGVALRVARSARRRAARLRDRGHVADGQARESGGSMAEVDRLDAAPIVHEEVGRLPEKYRAPLVLCYFEGLTHDQAASQLGWPVGTVRSRLAGARDRLRPRLLRRGVAPSVAILAASGLAEATVAVPTALASATVGMAIRAGVAGTVPVAVAALVGKTLGEMTAMKTTMIAASLIAAALVGTAGVGYVSTKAQTDEPKPVAAPESKVQTSEPGVSAVAPAGASGRGRDDLPRLNGRSGVSTSRVLLIRLKTAATNLQSLTKKYGAALIDFEPIAMARGEVDGLAAELDAFADDLRDELDLLRIQIRIKQAEVKAAGAQLAKVTQLHESTARNVANKVVSPNELSLSQKDVDVRAAELDRKRAELEEVELRTRQAARRSSEATAFAAEGKRLLSSLEPPTPDAKP
ncbi:RNA polymerase sigma factor [Singulisphaera sp. PoT]|uniref:RNA polymerase sigma factor n=1 Tax=Singulisphaera sp. PoT TaxID=3411797 RepID=UPI003BF4FF6C